MTPFHIQNVVETFPEACVETFPGACVCLVLNLLNDVRDVVLTMPYFRKSFSSAH